MPFGSEGVDRQIALCLSGGGFRASLFHVGGLWRLNELGLLSRIDRISSVSGGSITAGILAVHWNQLVFQNGVAENFAGVVNVVSDFCKREIDVPCVAEGALSPFSRASDELRKRYNKHLFRRATLQDLPERPLFIFCATNLQTRNCFRFSRPYAGDYRVGLIKQPTISVADAVAASSAFPPVLSPFVLKVPEGAFQAVDGADLNDNQAFTRKLYLCDGGVYDNLGLEPAWKRCSTVLVSDGGAPPTLLPKVKRGNIREMGRVLDIALEQTRALRLRHLVGEFKRDGARSGAYWALDTDPARFQVPGSLPCSQEKRVALAALRTRLAPFTDQEQGELINLGYAVADAAVRKYGPPAPIDAAAKWPIKGFPL